MKILLDSIKKLFMKKANRKPNKSDKKLAIAKYPNGTRVKVKVGHPMLEFKDGKYVKYDLRPELTMDTATVEYTYGEAYGGVSKDTFKNYSLRFDKHGLVSWFDEDNLIAVKNED